MKISHDAIGNAGGAGVEAPERLSGSYGANVTRRAEAESRIRAEVEARRARESAQGSYSGYRTLLETMNLGVVYRDNTGAIIGANPAACRMLGATLDEMLGRSAIERWQTLKEDGSPLSPEDRPEAVALRTGRPVRDTIIGLTGRGLSEVRWLRTNAIPEFRGGIQRPHLVFSIFEDITERRRVEDALRVAQELADRDPLTGLMNHRGFREELDVTIAKLAGQRRSLSVVLVDLDNFRFFNDAYGDTAGDDILCQAADRLRTLCDLDDTLARSGGDEFILLLQNREDEGRLGVVAPAEVETKVRAAFGTLEYHPVGADVAIPITISVGASVWRTGPNLPGESTSSRDALRRAGERLQRSKTGAGGEGEAQWFREFVGRQVEGFSMLDALVTSVDNKDRYTRQHSEDVLTYSVLIARELGLDEAMVRTVGMAALLHDVGKIGIPDAVLRKPDRLTDEEFAVVRQHPVIGAAIVGAVPGLESTLDAVRYHHENWTGGGYPSGLERESIPLIARLLSVADAFSAMTTSRPYRSNIDRSEALGILEAGAGKQWDPRCVSAFVTAIRRQEDI